MFPEKLHGDQSACAGGDQAAAAAAAAAASSGVTRMLGKAVGI